MENSRHNAGFDSIALLARKYGGLFRLEGVGEQLEVDLFLGIANDGVQPDNGVALHVHEMGQVLEGQRVEIDDAFRRPISRKSAIDLAIEELFGR